MRCPFRYPFRRKDWMKAAIEHGSDIPLESMMAAAQCILPEHRHDQMPHLVVNPWTKVVHAYEN